MGRGMFNLSAVSIGRISALLALLFALSSVPINVGFTIISGSAAPTISIDICHAPQSATTSSLHAVARPAPEASQALVLPELSIRVPQPIKAAADLRTKPEPPPPKALA
jgi:hypothetical protein